LVQIALIALSQSEPPYIKARICVEPSINSYANINEDDTKDYYRSIYDGGEE
jgi:hypothetical protein